MGKYIKLSCILLLALLLSGCASLGELAQELQAVDPSAEIAAVSALTDDFVNQPWDNILQVGLGYALALLRRMYKKKKGAK